MILQLDADRLSTDTLNHILSDLLAHHFKDVAEADRAEQLHHLIIERNQGVLLDRLRLGM
jgi:hypothetical protein